MANKAGLKGDEVAKCLEAHTMGPKVDADMAEGTDLGIKSTPTFFINGQMILGAQPVEAFVELIDEELSKK